MYKGLTNIIEKEHLLSKNTMRLLAKARFRTFKGLARMKLGTFLKKVPKITVRGLYSIEKCLDYRKLSFVKDGTISPFNDDTICSRKLVKLWRRGIVRYKDLNRFHYCELLKIMGEKIPDNSLCNAGFTEKTLDILIVNKIDTFKKITSMTEFDIACLFAGYEKKDKWPIYGSLAMARVREVKYLLWKNKRLELKSMNQTKKKLSNNTNIVF